MCPRPSPSWLKYELIWRARRAASVTRLNFESTGSSSSSIGGFIIVSWSSAHSCADLLEAASAALIGHAVGVDQRRRDAREHSSTVLQVVVDHHVIGEVAPDRLLLLGLLQPLADLVIGIAASAQAALLLGPRRRQHEDAAPRRGTAVFTCWAPSTSISSTTSRSGGGVGVGRAVVVTEEFGPLEEATAADALFERGGSVKT